MSSHHYEILHSIFYCFCIEYIPILFHKDLFSLLAREGYTCKCKAKKRMEMLTKYFFALHLVRIAGLTTCAFPSYVNKSSNNVEKGSINEYESTPKAISLQVFHEKDLHIFESFFKFSRYWNYHRVRVALP